MVLAIMQPYFLPYIGYFQLLNTVDKFVLYDDVNFITRGYINRNNLLVGGKPSLFTIPLKDASQNKLIREVQLADDNAWRKKLLKTVEQSYRKAPYFGQVYPLFEDMLCAESSHIGEFCHYAISRVCEYLEIKTKIVPSSTIYENAELKKQDRILDICLREKATHYINPQGGMELYDKETFNNNGIKLSFLKANLTPYTQFKEPFVTGLSILDVLMFNSIAETHTLLNSFELV